MFLDATNEFFDDEDESFYNDITFDPLNFEAKLKTNNNHVNNSFNKNFIHSNNINTNININNNNLIYYHNNQNFNPKPHQSYQNNSNNKFSHFHNSEPVYCQQAQEQDQQQQQSSSGRILSPAIQAKSIQVNRNIPLPGAQKRPPHLRINND